jgi:hypothetical protein
LITQKLKSGRFGLASSSIDLQIRIFGGEPLQVEIQAAGGRTLRLPLSVTPSDVPELNEFLSAAVQREVDTFGPGVKPHDIAAGVERLAAAGRGVFNRIFPDDTSRLVRDLTQRARSIQITSERFLIPWEMLYQGAKDEPTDVTGFWGMSRVVSRSIVSSRGGVPEFPHIVRTTPRCGLAVCRELVNVDKVEIPLFRKLKSDRVIDLDLLPALVPGPQGLRSFGTFLGAEREILHFACHAYPEKRLANSYMQVDDGFRVEQIQFSAEEFRLSGDPIVVLNACRTGTASPLNSFNWASTFLDIGARAVLATEFRVPDDFAPLFAREFYQRFLDGQSLGAAVVNARRRLWKIMGNPLGLAYGLYAAPATRIIRKG